LTFIFGLNPLNRSQKFVAICIEFSFAANRLQRVSAARFDCWDQTCKTRNTTYFFLLFVVSRQEVGKNKTADPIRTAVIAAEEFCSAEIHPPHSGRESSSQPRHLTSPLQVARLVSEPFLMFTSPPSLRSSARAREEW
jgi:hypothetical protein